jgi:transglutaminase-like putative cysteine protease
MASDKKMLLNPNHSTDKSLTEMALRPFLGTIRFGLMAFVLSLALNLSAAPAPGTNAKPVVVIHPRPAVTNAKPTAITDAKTVLPDAKLPVVPEPSPVVVTDAKPMVAPPSKWIVPLPFERLSKQTKIDLGEEQHWLLLNRQINGQENEFYSHSVRQILTSAGVQKGSHISIEFDPTYQSLTLHWVRLWRGTNLLNRLDLAKIKVIQQERELDQYLFNGEQSAVLLLEDVRAGDIVDYAFTIRGHNPVFSGKFTGSVPVQIQQPVERLATRVLWPVQRRLYTKNHGTAVKPVVLRKGNFFEYTWDCRKVAGLPYEDALPGWYDPEPWVQLSEFEKWGDVNQWAMGLFTNTAPFSPELTQKISEWRRLAIRETRLLTILKFMQDEVRYLGIEIGPNSHKPSSPSTVFERRFGDCKDKTMLFITVLRALGTEANPVLVHTKLRRTLDNWQPSPAFDHVIAQVKLDNQLYYLDPTATYERGPLATRSWPNYERGLVVRPGTMALMVIPPSPVAPKTTVTEYFHVRGKEETADLEVRTVAEGADAETLREQFATSARDEIEKSYLNFYAGRYPGISQMRPIAFFDNEQQNRFEVSEFYSIEKIWNYSSEDKEYRCNFSPHTLTALLKKPAVSFRTMPLRLRFPQHQIFRAEVLLPRSWPVNEKGKTIQDPAFFFRSDISASGPKLLLEYEYRALADSVATTQLTGYMQQLDDTFQHLGYTLFWR